MGEILFRCHRIVGLREITPDGRLGVGSQLMFHSSGDVDYTAKDEGESCGGKDQDCVEDDK